MDKITETEKKQPAIICSFCGKSQHEVKRIIVGEHDDRNPAICNECIELARNIIIEEKNKESDQETDI